MPKFDRNELISALAVLAVGAGGLWIASGYSMGTVVRMGAGFVPAALCIILILLGLALVVQSEGAAPVNLEIRWRPFVLILDGILAWALLVDRVGFVPATVVMVLCCAMAERDTNWKSALALSLGLCLFGYVVFIWGLKIPIAVLGDH